MNIRTTHIEVKLHMVDSPVSLVGLRLRRLSVTSEDTCF